MMEDKRALCKYGPHLTILGFQIREQNTQGEKKF
jgi:hypothetical protein